MFQVLPSKGWVHCPFLFLCYFISNLFISSSAWLCPTSLLIIMLILLHQHDHLILPTSWLCLPSYVILAYFYRHCLLGCTLFMYSLIVPISIIPFISLPALKSSLPIYNGHLPFMYLNFDLHQSICWSSVHLLWSLLACTRWDYATISLFLRWDPAIVSQWLTGVNTRSLTTCMTLPVS